MFKNICQDESPRNYFSGIAWVYLIFVLSILGSLKVENLLQENSVVSANSLTDIILSLIFFGVFLFAFDVFNRLKGIKILKGIVFYAMIFWGALTSLNFFMSDSISLIVFLVFFSTYLANRRVWLHNLLTAFGFAGVAGIIGFSFPPIITFIFLIIFAMYVMAKKSLYDTCEYNDIFGLIVPRNLVELTENLKRRTKKYIVAKAGMFILPGMVCASMAAVSLEKALIIGVFAVFGFMASSYLFSFERNCSSKGVVMTMFFATAFGYLISSLF
jgi:presenilin-like A22 family membrane protease